MDLTKLLSINIGAPLNGFALLLNVKGATLGIEHINLYLTGVISLLAIVWSLMKIYDQYLVTKKRKADK